MVVVVVVVVGVMVVVVDVLLNGEAVRSVICKAWPRSPGCRRRIRCCCCCIGKPRMALAGLPSSGNARHASLAIPTMLSLPLLSSLLSLVFFHFIPTYN